MITLEYVMYFRDAETDTQILKRWILRERRLSNVDGVQQLISQIRNSELSKVQKMTQRIIFQFSFFPLISKDAFFITPKLSQACFFGGDGDWSHTQRCSGTTPGSVLRDPARVSYMLGNALTPVQLIPQTCFKENLRL